jgi:hypothetical protein
VLEFSGRPEARFRDDSYESDGAAMAD